MLIYLSPQDRPVTIHSGSEGVVILSSDHPADQALSVPPQTLRASSGNRRNGSIVTRYARQIVPYVIVATFAFWGGRHLLSGREVPSAPSAQLLRPDLPKYNTRDMPRAPTDMARPQPIQPTPQDNPNSAFGLN